jgi:hypothetical protein
VVIFVLLTPDFGFADTSLFACGEPGKQKTENLSIDWARQSASYKSYDSVEASYWSPILIQWTHPMQTEDASLHEKNLSLQLNMNDMTLMYTILDEGPVLPKSDDDWAVFLPVYMVCREFF